MQHLLTMQREAAAFQRLDVIMRALDAGDSRRMAWLNCDTFSIQWVTSLPTKQCYLDDGEFREVAALYYDLPSPSCNSLVRR